MNLEQVYDAEIEPLMAKIIAVCKEHKIPMLATFAIATDEDPDLEVITALLGDDYDPPASYIRAFEEVRPRRHTSLMMMTISPAPKPTP